MAATAPAPATAATLAAAATWAPANQERALEPWARLDDPTLRTLAFAHSVAAGLSARPRRLSARWLYDEVGSRLFEDITRTPEYYLTRAETRLLRASAADIRAKAGTPTLVELGAGTATKTRLLLDAWCARGPATYVAVDICGEVLEHTCSTLRSALPRLRVHGIAGSYEQALPLLRERSPLTLAFLGSTVGNLDDDELADFLHLGASHLTPGDALLLGFDLVKDPAVLEAAYDDSAGVTSRFTRNLFARMNRELGCNLDLTSIEHCARYDEVLERIEIHARFARGATIALPAIGRSFRISPGEVIRTEISRKFRTESVLAMAREHGFSPLATYVDPSEPFALVLLRANGSLRSPVALVRGLRSAQRAIRARTEALIAPLDESALRRQHSPLMSPILWDLAHIANFADQWIERAFPDAAGARSRAARTARDRTYDAMSHPRAARGTLPLLDAQRCRSYLTEVATRVDLAVDALDPDVANPLLQGGYVFSMLEQHEAQHGETILQTISLIPELEYEPHWRANARRSQRRPDEARIVVPAGAYPIGTSDRSVAYDNERPRHLVDLASFAIDVLPVSNRLFLEFVLAGGYRRKALWCKPGWLWLRASGVKHPGGWLRRADGTWWECRFGRQSPLDPDRPVIHVSWYEADAFARWRGARLPSELEWEKAAGLDLERGVARTYPWGDGPPTDDRANLGQRTFGPAQLGAYPAGRSALGCEQMIGDVWEWTSSEFLPYPGFEAFPYPEYSAVHFGRGHRVLRGGSWATSPCAIRNTFRNWDLPERRQIFAGLRCAWDA